MLMLTIRTDQMRIFSWMAWNSFEGRMVAHLGEFFPQRCKTLGEEKTRETIQQGTVNARKYGIISEHDVCIYIDMMFEYGDDFDVDPELPWASQVLNDPEIRDPTYKVNRLFDAAMDQRKSGAKAHE
jgi:hypothetical protein